MNMAEPITIRQLTPADAAAYRSLRLAGLRAFPHAFRPDYEEAVQQPLSWAEQRLAKAGEYWFGAFDEATLVGAICLRTQAGRKIRHSASLNALVVDPERQRQGVARALVAHLIGFARSLEYIRQLTLTVHDGNTNAERLYDAFGFRQFGLEPDAFLHDGRYYAKQHRQLQLDSPTS
ncbi:GNAT family N-acetyltransferase [Massilia norwichensis]|uniref:GNAT family N-acetyltransferase n=1 Tax=Massilia norwichensis TaxID=1442366 RepID=A0ABT2A5D3_9BURK|nr:GNAT family N-acetyltransferase [Massilia norwichensis]MCS0589400.1 GNAT family N-acetyltransferase [Massilia norwichensis]